MTPAELAATLREVLWPSTGRVGWKVYAILDAARNEAIYPMVKASPLPSVCLYAGKLPEVMLGVAPYLVELRKDAPLTKDLVEKAWGDSWGVFVLSNATLEELRRHFRRFLKVEDATGKTLIFRFYDPRVLRAYLPTCNALELGYVFGPVSMFVMEGEKAEVIPFYRKGDELGVAATSPG